MWKTVKPVEIEKPHQRIVYCLYHGGLFGSSSLGTFKPYINFFLKELNLDSYFVDSNSRVLNLDLAYQIHKYLPKYYKEKYGESINNE